MTEIDDFRAEAQRWAKAHYGDASEVAAVVRMPGNSGLSFGFELHVAGTSSRRLVARLAPVGVKVSGNTDVLRQVPLLNALARHHIAVPAVWFSTNDHRWFGTDVVMVDFVDALPLHMRDASLSAPIATAAVEASVLAAVNVLAEIHSLPWKNELSSWATPLTPAGAVSFWNHVLSRGAEPEWIEQATLVRDVLLATSPTVCPVGVFHGDFQTNNILFDRRGDIAAVVDWEIAGIGPTTTDLAWLAMWTDKRCWESDLAAGMRVVVDDSLLVDAYEQATRQAVLHFAWFRAVACYEFATIAAFNLRLHRTGRRTDPWYELLAPSVPVLLRRAMQLLGRAVAS